MKIDKEEQVNETSVALLIGIAISIIYVALAIGLALKGPSAGLSGDRLIIVELVLLALFLLLLLLVKFLEGALLWIASLKAIRWFHRYDEKKRAQSNGNNDEADATALLQRRQVLRDMLRDRYGLRWRYRNRWVMLAGEASLVERLVPALKTEGFTVQGDLLLVQANRTDGKLDEAWLDELRRLRRRRPVDAIVVLTHARDSSNKPFDAEAIGQGLARHARALRWSAPAYLLNVKETRATLSKRDEAIGCVWSTVRPDQAYIDDSLGRLAHDLSDVGTARLALDPYDGVAAEMGQQIERLRGNT